MISCLWRSTSDRRGSGALRATAEINHKNKISFNTEGQKTRTRKRTGSTSSIRLSTLIATQEKEHKTKHLKSKM